MFHALGWTAYAIAVVALLVAAWRQAGRADAELAARRAEWHPGRTP